jgi:hypothetical protein
MSAKLKPGPSDREWLEHLEADDLAFLRRFVLASGSLKETAQTYGISYPTVRLRLDRLIAKIRVFESSEIQDPFERTLRAAHADGKVDLDTLRKLLSAHRESPEADR